MKIAASEIALASTHEASLSQTSWARLRVQDNRSQQTGNTPQQQARPQVDISRQARMQLEQDHRHSNASSTASGNTSETSAVDNPDSGESLPAGLRILKDIVEAMTGEKIRFFSGSVSTETSTASVEVSSASASATPRAGWRIQLDTQTIRAESESTQFSATGSVTLADGSTLAFKLNLSMQRTEVTATSTSFRAGDPPPSKDPLVLNFSGAALTATGANIAFDLSNDGGTGQLPVLQGGGYLVLDRNANGKADNGGELFGPKSGDGFSDLAALDDDGNGWIDEADLAFAQLKVWQPTADGSGSLSSLKDSGVGALYLGKTASPFTLKDGDGTIQANVRTSGVYLNEDGTAGALQQIDVVA